MKKSELNIINITKKNIQHFISLFPLFFNTLKKILKEKKASEKGEITITVGGLIAIIVGVVGLVLGVAAIMYWPKVLEGLISAILLLLTTISQVLLTLALNLFDSIVAYILANPNITKQPIVSIGWKFCQSFANMFVVLGFVAIALATILRFREYEAQKKLLPLIVVALLINFSPLICGMVIDVSNAVLKYFLGEGGTFVSGSYRQLLNEETIIYLLKKAEKDEKNKYFIAGLVIQLIFQLIAAMVFYLYSILLFIRPVALMCLVILSPLAFVCYVFPLTYSVFQKWLSQFLQWSFVGAASGFFLYLSGYLLATFTVSLPSSDTVRESDLISFFIPTFFLYYSYTLILQTSAIGAGAAIGAATGLVRWAGGMMLGAGIAVARGGAKLAGKAAMGGIDKISGGRISNLKEGIKGSITRFGETIGVLKAGTTAQQRAARIEEAKKRMGVLQASSAAGDRQTFENLVRSGRGIEAAAAIEVAAERGELRRILRNNLPAMNARINYARSISGRERGDFDRLDYRLAGMNEEKLNSYTQQHWGINFNQGTEVQQAAAYRFVRRQQLLENLPNMSPNQIRNIDDEDLTPELFRDSRMDRRYIAVFQGSSLDRIARIQESLGASDGSIPDTLYHDLHQAISTNNQAEARRLQGIIAEIERLAPRTPPSTPPPPESEFIRSRFERRI